MENFLQISKVKHCPGDGFIVDLSEFGQFGDQAGGGNGGNAGDGGEYLSLNFICLISPKTP